VWTEIAAAFGIPLAAIGFTENVNLANADAMMEMVYRDTIIPQLELYKRQLTRKLASEFGDDWMLDFDTSDLTFLQESLDSKVKNATALFNMGVPFNVLNEKLKLNIGDIDGGEIGYINPSLMPTDLSGENITEEQISEIMKGIVK
jgi:hypothetical protein